MILQNYANAGGAPTVHDVGLFYGIVIFILVGIIGTDYLVKLIKRRLSQTKDVSSEN